MATLADFPPPGKLPTVCERNSKLLSTDDGYVVTDYRRIDLTDTSAHVKSLACLEDVCKPAFICQEQNLIEELKGKWHTKGITGILEILQSSNKVHKSLNFISSKLYTGLAIVNSWNERIFPKKAIHEVADNVTLLACHPHIGKIAIALEDQSVKVLTINRIADQNVLLKDKRIKNVTCLSWRPKSSMSLAVGSNQGVLVWLLDPNITTVRSGSNMTRFLQSSGMTSDVSSISWCADGKILACSCVNSSSFWIWDVVSERCTPIHRVGSALSFVNWSPCGQRLLTANRSEIFRVWETMKWTCEKWADLNGSCTNACWSSCGSYLLFTVSGEAIIYYVYFGNNDKNSSNIDIGSAGVALKCADLSACVDSNEEEEIGGVIKNMVWDPTNSRLALTCQGSSNNQPYVVLFHTRTTPLLQLVPCGFIRGDVNEIPLKIDFLHGYDKGALLTVYWSTKTISLVPLLYNQNLSSSPKYQMRTIDSVNQTFTEVTDYNMVPNETQLYSASYEKINF